MTVQWSSAQYETITGKQVENFVDQNDGGSEPLEVILGGLIHAISISLNQGGNQPSLPELVLTS